MKYITLLNKVRKVMGLKMLRKIPFIPERDIVLPSEDEIAKRAVRKYFEKSAITKDKLEGL